MFRRTIFALFVFLMAAPALGQSQSYDVRDEAARVSGQALKSSFAGVTHKGAYNFDARGRADNRFTEWHGADGKILYREGELLAKGTWTLARDMICYNYDDDRLSGGCFEVYKLGTCYYFYDSAVVNFAATESIFWTARSVPKGQSATCEAMIS